MKQCSNQNRPPTPSGQISSLLPAVAMVLFWQELPDLPTWLWFLLASSPLVLIIILLGVAIVILLLVIWLRARRQHKQKPAVSPPEKPPTPAPPPSQPAAYSENLAKTQPGPAAGPAAPAPTITPTPDAQTLPASGQRPARIGWLIAGLTDVGLKRDLNEDTLLMAEATMPDGAPYGLYVVADGLGGHHGGEIASQLTIDAIHQHFIQEPPLPPEESFGEWLKNAAMAANRAVLAHQENLAQAKKMGSTVVMALVMGHRAHIANVGDSRAYLLQPEHIEQISVDHSLVERLVQIGQLTREEARTHKNRNVIYNTIGEKPDMDVSLYHTTIRPGERLLLCSDGLSGMVTDDDLLAISQNQPAPDRACRAMIEAAKLAGGSDNITCIIVQMNGG